LSSLVILGSSSFLGKVFLNNVKDNFFVKAVVRKIPIDKKKYSKNIQWIKINTFNISSIKNILGKEDVVVNLIYLKDNRTANIKLINNIINACIESKVAKLIHLSTASVAGNVKDRYINELTLCKPKSNYEKVKMEIEKIVLSGLSREFDIGILRPTAIVGYGGKNLKKLSN